MMAENFPKLMMPNPSTRNSENMKQDKYHTYTLQAYSIQSTENLGQR